MNIVISSGHGKYIRGARGNPVPPQCDEVDEARKVVEGVAGYLRELGVGVTTYHDDVSRTQNENLKRICDFHNSRVRDLDVSVHFNAYDGSAHGTECLYVTQADLADEVAAAIAKAGQLTNRGGKKRTDLYFLNNTAEPAILVETAFCDNTSDCNLYRVNFDLICSAIAQAISGEESIAPSPPVGALLTGDEVGAILDAATSSAIARYGWKDRGKSPAGYVKGIAVAYGTVVRKFQAGDSSAIEMSRANSHNSDKDALSWYAGKFDELGMPNDADGLDTLRHLWVLLMGLGMRESSGRYCEGRDQSATNTTSDTAEAGLFQSSWNFHSSSDEIDKLFAEYQDDSSNCYEDVFAEGVSCSSSDWSIYGSGDGAAYQDLAKHCPAFACESTAVGLRNIRQHWGPINRYEAELRAEADQLFMQVEAILGAEPEPVPPEQATVAIQITATGPVTVTINGTPIGDFS
jgi:N-acetylmuramoyl-L-alanine amidase